MSAFTLTKLRTFRGHEGQGINAVLCRDGKPVAFILDDANGGGIEVDFTNPGQNAKSYQAHHASAHEEQRLAHAFAVQWFDESPDAAEARAFEAELQRQFPDSDRPTVRGYGCLESWINHQVDAMREKKALDRASKTKTLFRLKDEAYGPGDWRTIKLPYGPKVQDYLARKYGERVAEIYGVQR